MSDAVLQEDWEGELDSGEQPEFERDDGDDIDVAAFERHRIAGTIAYHRGAIKRLEKELKDKDQILQAMMFGRKAVKTVHGYTLVWKSSKRAGYTVAPWEGERWEVRGPH